MNSGRYPDNVVNEAAGMDGLELKIERVRAGLTLWQLGKLAGVHPARISEMERGQRPIAEVVVQALDRQPSEASRRRPP